MRKELKNIENKRMQFIGYVERFGEKSAFRGMPLKTVLIKNIKIADSNKLVSDHSWFTCGKNLSKIEVGDTISFVARVTEYQRGYKGCDEYLQMEHPIEDDYRLSNPTKVCKITQ